MNEKPETPRYHRFSSTDRPITNDTKLWRYLTFEKFAWLVQKSELYHRRLDLLGDKFEGSVTKIYAQKREGGILPRHLTSGLPAEIESLSIKLRLVTHFAVCWHNSKHETAAMWKLYSAESAGVAIVSNPKRIFESVDLSPYRTGIFGPVEYLDFDVDDMTLPFAKKARTGFLKMKSFEYEREVRGMIHLENWGDNEFDLTQEYLEKLKGRVPTGLSVRVDLQDLIENIYVSPLAPPHFRDVVQGFSEHHGLGDRIRSSTLTDDPVY